jgi:DNA polymerase I
VTVAADRTRTRVIDSVSELPDPSKITTLYADAETISGNRKRGGNRPYLGDRAVGWGITVDDDPRGFYVPLRHCAVGRNLYAGATNNVNPDQFRRWMNDAMRSSREWVNHNIKFDAHFARVDGIESCARLVDTLTLAKVVDGQRSGSDYGLKPLTTKWLGEATDERDEVDAELRIMKTKDFGQIDAGVLGPYAVDDVHRNRRLWADIQRRRYEGDEKVWEMEINVTRALFNIECRPIVVDQDRLGELRTVSSMEMEKCEDKFAALGYSVEVASDKKTKDFVFGYLGLPKISFNERGSPSIDHAAIDAYLVHETVRNDPKLVEFFQTLLVYREHSQFISLYANGWEKCMDPGVGVLHPFYNQTVSTGRMSCTSPNLQQLNKLAKSCILPGPGRAFISRDYSQIEYRIIASFCKDPRMIAAYRDNPDTDFHEFVAQLCGIGRRPAKSVNFGIAFSMGVGGLIRQLRASLGDVTQEQAESVLNDYRREFPRVEEVSKKTVKRAQGRAGFKDGEWGYIKTLYGRRRYLRYYKYRSDPKERSKYSDETRLAFNSAVQGTAADIMKEGLVKMDQNELLNQAGVGVAVVIHDDFVGAGPTESIRDRDVQEEYGRTMCNPSVDLGLPLIASGRESEINMAEAT